MKAAGERLQIASCKLEIENLRFSICKLQFAIHLFVLAMLPLAAAAREQVGDVEVNVQPPPSLGTRSGDESFHGYIEYRVQLRNRAKQDRVVHLQIPSSRGYRGEGGTVDSRTVQIAGEQEAIVSLYQSPMEGNGSMEVGVEGVSESKTVVVGAIATGYRGGPVWGATWARSLPCS